MILSYELSDDIGTEHEVEVESIEAAAKIVNSLTDYIVWWTLTDDEGNEVASSLAY